MLGGNVKAALIFSASSLRQDSVTDVAESATWLVGS